jgi:hypothetical protein
MLFKIKFRKSVCIGRERLSEDKSKRKNTINQVNQRGKDICIYRKSRIDSSINNQSDDQ